MSGQGPGRGDDGKPPAGSPDLDDGIEREETVAPNAPPGETRQLPLVLDDQEAEAVFAELRGGTWGGEPPPLSAGEAAEGHSDAGRGDSEAGGHDPAEAEIPIVTIDYDAPFGEPALTEDLFGGAAIADMALGELQEAPPRTADDHPAPSIIAIASGRGGAGKSLLAANMAVYLAQIGKRVVAVDADPAGGTLNHLLGTPRPGRGFGSFLRGRAETLDELAVDTPVAGVRLIAGETLAFGSPPPKSNGKTVLAALRAISADIIVVDLGPPDSALCLDIWLGAQTSMVVTLADPASIEATYRFVKSAFLRRLRGERGLDKLQVQVGRPLPAALDLYRVALEVNRTGRDDDGGAGASAASGDGGGTSRGAAAAGGNGSARGAPRIAAAASALAQIMAQFRPRFVVAQTRSLGDTKLGPQISMAAHRRLGHAFDYFGHVESDETVAAATRRHRPVMSEFPEAKVCRNIEKIVRRILSSETERPSAALPPRLEVEQTFYEILETEPGVSDEEIRRAFRLFKEIYAVGSPVIAGLYEESELTALHERANAAHDTLFAPERRRLYDLSLPEADLARAVRRASQAARLDPAAGAAVRSEAASSAHLVDKDAEVTGAFLRKMREARGMELAEVAQRTKIGERHLRAIEEERFDELPAPVYVRGFVTQIARILHIDPSRAGDTYLRRFHGALGPGAGTPVLKELAERSASPQKV